MFSLQTFAVVVVCESVWIVSPKKKSFHFFADFLSFSAFRYICNCFFLQYLKVNVAHLRHDGVKAAAFFIAVFALFIKI